VTGSVEHADAGSATRERSRVGRRLLRSAVWMGGVVVLLLVAAFVAFQTSYWPTVWLLRHQPDVNGATALEALTTHVPEGTTGVLGEQYRPGDRDAQLDVFWDEGTVGAQPTVVWVHGGAFVGGTRAGTEPYLRILAAEGFTTVNVEYSAAPEQQYPTQVEQVAGAIAYVVQDAERLHVDPDRIVLAGDSAGAHIAAQTALAISDDAYARETGLPQPIRADQLVATVLACGPYDLEIADRAGGLLGHAQNDILWAYSGVRDFADDPTIAYASLPQHVTAAYPPTFITAGDDDPLEAHSRSLTAALQDQAVEVDALFFPAGTGVPHEYQFDLDAPPGREALDRITAFLTDRTT
jgi:acetyl esterase/lipase